MMIQINFKLYHRIIFLLQKYLLSYCVVCAAKRQLSKYTENVKYMRNTISYHRVQPKICKRSVKNSHLERPHIAKNS